MIRIQSAIRDRTTICELHKVLSHIRIETATFGVVENGEAIAEITTPFVQSM